MVRVPVQNTRTPVFVRLRCEALATPTVTVDSQATLAATGAKFLPNTCHLIAEPQILI